RPRSSRASPSSHTSPLSSVFLSRLPADGPLEPSRESVRPRARDRVVRRLGRRARLSEGPPGLAADGPLGPPAVENPPHGVDRSCRGEQATLRRAVRATLRGCCFRHKSPSRTLSRVQTFALVTIGGATLGAVELTAEEAAGEIVIERPGEPDRRVVTRLAPES